jgi:hypothetical protein
VDGDSRVRLVSPAARLSVRSALGLGAALALVAGLAPPAFAQGYVFTKVVDSAADGFDPFSFECSAINNRGDIAFRTARVDPVAPRLIQGIYRANTEGDERLTTIAEFGESFDFLSQIPSINDLGEVAFAVRQTNKQGNETLSVIRATGTAKKDTTVLAEAPKKFNRVGFEPTINNSSVVALKAETDTIDTFDFEDGLFSGSKQLTANYLSSTSEFSEFSTLSRPSVNNLGAIAFEERVDPDSIPGIFVTAGDSFTTIAAPDPNVNPGWPTLNDPGTVAFHRIFNDRAGAELVSGNGGPLTVIANTDGPFASFGFFFGLMPPALNNNGDVAFLADLDAGGSGIFVGPDAVADKVIATGDLLDGSPVADVRFCDEGLNDSGQLAFQVTFDDPTVPDGRRIAIYRATPVS